VNVLRARTLICLGCLVVVVGCGGDPAPKDGARQAPKDGASPRRDGAGARPKEEVQLGKAQPKGRSVVVAALGDSITAGSPSWDPDPGVRNRIGEVALDPESQYEYWAQLRLPDARFRNCGVFGERTDEIAARLGDCARGASILVVQGGINDIAQMRPVEGAARNLRRTVQEGRRMRLRVALVEVLPWNNGYPGADARIRRLNEMIAKIGRDLGVPVYPWYRRLEDPHARGRMRADWTIDGDHPSVKGYKRLAADVKLP
jgi:lysophospholipase L1-like esterase